MGPGAHSPDVVAIHVLLGAPMDDPVGQLLPTATAQHHSWQEQSHRSATRPQSAPSIPAPPTSTGSLTPQAPDPMPGHGHPRGPHPLPPGLSRAPGPAPRLGGELERQSGPPSLRRGPGPLPPTLACTVEAAAQEESSEFGRLPHQGLVVRREGLCKGGGSLKFPPGHMHLGQGLRRGSN